MRFFFDEGRKLMMSLDLTSTGSVYTPNILSVPGNFKECLEQDINSYDLFGEVDLPTVGGSRSRTDVGAQSVAEQLLGSIVEFDGCFFYLTSGNVFIYSHPAVDDCAFGTNTPSYSQRPTAVVNEKFIWVARLFLSLQFIGAFTSFL
ncbi:unnamed protein product [Mucor hiemalis]